MSSQQERTSRIVIALDSVSGAQAALEAAARLASACQAELHGLFVEDENLLRLAALPFACEVDYASGESRPVQSVSVERAWQVAAKQFQRTLASFAKRDNLKWTFRTTRGLVDRETLAAASASDVLVISRTQQMMTYQPSQRTDRGVIVICDGQESGLPTLELAISLADAVNQPISVVVTAPTKEEVDAAAAKCEQRLREHELASVVRHAVDPSASALCKLVEAQHVRMLVVDSACAWVDDAAILRLLKEVNGPLIVV